MARNGTSGAVAERGNRILQALDPHDRVELEARLAAVFLKVKTVLYEPGEPVDSVCFPIDAVISLVTPLEDGAIVEVATVGNEGLVGVPAVPGGAFAVRAITQVAGRALTMGISPFLDSIKRTPPLAALVDRYVQALFGQISQAAACNRLHSNEERLSRWLLMSHDRVGVDSFLITQEFLGQMLGSRRATVTLSAGILQRAGLIRYHRGHVEIVNRDGLEATACECYQVIQSELSRVTPALA
ncbi:MAG TPA: Crp/Fnr family transcriptional regulator [Candidatus Micrarchaeia archaeon]|nr:Crp/Fnr family transcriptional regulator [Candidatus Micrarchaeia archaeon]